MFRFHDCPIPYCVVSVVALHTFRDNSSSTCVAHVLHISLQHIDRARALLLVTVAVLYTFLYSLHQHEGRTDSANSRHPIVPSMYVQSWRCFSGGVGRDMKYRSAAFYLAKCKRTLHLSTFHIKRAAVI